jgi:hypothetical protein
MKRTLFFLWAVSLMLSACGQLGLEGRVIAPTEPPTATATSNPDPTATALPTAAPNVLPAPLYFISMRNNQIWRIERDGMTMVQITREAFDIDDFDASPVDGALVYVSNNTLYRSDANGGNRVVLVDSPKVDATDYKGLWERQIRSPRWRPNGAEVYFGQGGLNFIAADGAGGPHNIVPASAYPENLTTRPSEPPVNYWPHSFSPDNAFVLILKQYYPEGISPVLMRLNSSAPPMELSNDYGPNCCDITWSQDSQHLYVGNHAPNLHGLDSVGLWRAAVADGKFMPLVRGYTGDLSQPPAAAATFTSINYAFEANGRLFAFANVRPATDAGQLPPDELGLARVGADGTVTLISAEKYQTIETLGATDGSGAVLVDIADWNNSGPYPLGQLRWLPSTGSPAVDLIEKGSHLRWGK